MTRDAFARRVSHGRFHVALERSRAGLGAAGATAALTSGLLSNVIPHAWIAALGAAIVAGALASYVIDPRQTDDFWRAGRGLVDVTDPKQRGASLVLFVLAFLYVLCILVFDSLKAGRLVISKNALRHLLDGLTFSTGVTIGYGIYEPSFFKIVASNGVYTTVTAATCILGPLINLADRYDRLVEE